MCVCQSLTLECLEQIQPNLVHILLTTWREGGKENCRCNITLAPLGVGVGKGNKQNNPKTLERLRKLKSNLLHLLLTTWK